MASRELYSSIAKPKKKYTFGQKLGDVGKLYADTMLSTLGASDVISDDAYKGEWAKKTSGILSPIAGVAGQVALAAATGGTGNAALSAAKAVGPEIFAKGGLRTFKGNTHEQGGIKLGADEVEDSETIMPMDAQSDFIFSDRLYPIKSISPKGKIIYSKKTFAQKSKEINKPLEIRPNDPYAKKTADIKLKKLAQEQEILKSTTIKSPANHMAMGGMRYDGGGGRDRIGGIDLNLNVEDRTTPFKMEHLPAKVTSRFDYKLAHGFAHPYYPGWSFRTKGLSKDVLEGNTGMPPITPQEYYLASYGETNPLERFVNYIDDDGEPKSNYDFGIQDLTGDWRGFVEGVSGYEAAKPFGDSEKDRVVFDTPLLSRFEQEYAHKAYAGKPKGALAATKGDSSDYITPLTPKDAGQITSTKSKLLIPQVRPKASPEEPTIPYQSNFLIPALGYAAQALTNIPGLLAKPETINSSRVKFKDINLAEQRNEARRSRNLGLATARGIGSTDAGQMMNYLSGTTAGLNSVYGNQFNQSLLQEEQANAEMNMREQLANSEIERYDEQINTQERDAIRNLKMQALSNIGTSAAMAGKSYLDMQQGDAQINAYGKADPYYAANNKGVYRKEGSRFDGGGKRTKDPLAGVTINKGGMQGEVPISGQFYDPTKHPLYPNIDNNTYYGGVLSPTEIIATSQTPVYRGDSQSRIEDARTLPGYKNLSSRGQYPEKVRGDMMKATLQQPIDPFAQGMQEFSMATAGAASPGTPALSNWAKAGIAATGIGGGTALRYSDNEAAQNLGEYMQLIGGVEALPFLVKGLDLIPPLAKGILKFGKKIPPALKKATKASAKFVKDNPRTLYVPALGAKYGYDSYTNKKNKKASDIENMYKEIPSEVTNKILENIRKERK